jgi:hypothetical protein
MPTGREKAPAGLGVIVRSRPRRDEAFTAFLLEAGLGEDRSLDIVLRLGSNS